MRNSEQITTLANAMLLMEQVGDSLTFGVMIANTDGVAHFQNKIFSTWMPDYPPDHKLWFLQMQPYLDGEHEGNAPLRNRSVNWLLENNTANNTEIVVSWQNQRLFFRIKTQPLYNEKNQICGLIETTENITDFRHLEYALQQSRRFETVGRLASGIAHDFNNILQVINGHCEMLLEAYQNDHKLHRSLDVILTSGQKASALTRQLLLFSRRQQNEFKQINLGDMILGMQKIIVRMLGEDIAVNLNCLDKGSYIEGDESQLEQIIMNLAINARDAMPNGGEIFITVDVREIASQNLINSSLGKAGNYICFEFTDSGIGMTKDLVEHIFEPFFTTKESGRGTGLGLATVYSIIKQHRGFINVDSEPGIGTTFRLHFPCCESATVSGDIECAVAPQNGDMESVLIIEDDELVRDLASQVLSNYGYRVQCVSNLAQAYELLQTLQFDLFLIDIVLPDGNGVDFIEKVKERHGKSAFILSSGYTEDKPQIKHTIEMGYNFLHKPYTIASLLTTCKDALAAKKC